MRAGLYNNRLEQVDITPCRKTVPFQIKDRVCDQLSRSVESRLPTAEGFVEFCPTPWCFRGQGFPLLGGDCADLSSTARIYRMELRGDDCRIWCRSGERVCFVGKKSGYEILLDLCGVRVVCEAWEMEMPQDHLSAMGNKIEGAEPFVTSSSPSRRPARVTFMQAPADLRSGLKL